MQDWLTAPLAWDDSRRLDRGKVMTRADLDAGREFGRYLDVDGDGIPYRTYPGTHPTKGIVLHARHDQGPLRALHRKRARRTSTTCSACCANSRPRRSSCPAPVIDARGAAHARRRDLVRLDGRGDGRVACGARPPTASISTGCALRAFPFADAITEFIAAHEQGVRRRAEPRRAAQDDACQRVRHRSGRS